MVKKTRDDAVFVTGFHSRTTFEDIRDIFGSVGNIKVIFQLITIINSWLFPVHEGGTCLWFTLSSELPVGRFLPIAIMNAQLYFALMYSVLTLI